MKFTAICSLVLATLVSAPAFAQADSMKGMNHAGMKTKDMDMQECMAMKGMKDMKMDAKDMKNMDAHMCKAMMTGSDGKHAAKHAKMKNHKAAAVVKEIDTANGKVMLAHQPVKSLNWPAMTMGFKVVDKSLLPKLAVGKKVNVEFRKEGEEYVIVKAK